MAGRVILSTTFVPGTSASPRRHSRISNPLSLAPQPTARCSNPLCHTRTLHPPWKLKEKRRCIRGDWIILKSAIKNASLSPKQNVREAKHFKLLISFNVDCFHICLLILNRGRSCQDIGATGLSEAQGTRLPAGLFTSLLPECT